MEDVLPAMPEDKESDVVLVMEDKRSAAISAWEKQLTAAKKALRGSRKVLNQLRNSIFFSQLLLNGLIMSASALSIPMELLAVIAGAVVVFKFLEARCKFEGVLDLMGKALRALKRIEHDLKTLKEDDSPSEEEDEEFRKLFEKEFKKILKHVPGASAITALVPNTPPEPPVVPEPPAVTTATSTTDEPAPPLPPLVKHMDDQLEQMQTWLQVAWSSTKTMGILATTLQITVNTGILVIALLELPEDLRGFVLSVLAIAALVNTIVKGLEKHFKFDSMAGLFKEGLDEVTVLKEELEQLKLAPNKAAVKEFKQDYGRAMKEINSLWD